MIKNEDTYCVVYHKIVRELGAWEAVVYSTIATLLRKTDGIGEVSNQTLMDMLGKDRKSLSRWIDSLIQSGYIEKQEGRGRGNISMYYITQKGENLSAFITEKRGQNDPKKGTKNTIKGDNLPPINKGEIKEKKESGGDSREYAQATPLSDTTPQIFESDVFHKNKNAMNDFLEFWNLYPEASKFEYEKENCDRVWSEMKT